MCKWILLKKASGLRQKRSDRLREVGEERRVAQGVTPWTEAATAGDLGSPGVILSVLHKTSAALLHDA